MRDIFAGLREQMAKEDAEEAARRGITVEQLNAERKAAYDAAHAAVERQEAERKAANRQALEDLQKTSGLPFGFWISHAYHPRQGPNMHYGDHIVTAADFTVGRLSRKRGQALCTPREFWGLEPVEVTPGTTLDKAVTCSTCLERARSIAKTAAKAP